MTKEELIGYLPYASRFTEISRCNMHLYPGICRRIFAYENRLRLDFIDFTYNNDEEGEESFIFIYPDSESMVKSALAHTSGEISYYSVSVYDHKFETEDTNIIGKSWNKLFDDLYEHNLCFPSGACELIIRTHFARAVFMRLVHISDSSEKIKKTIMEHIQEIEKTRFCEY